MKKKEAPEELPCPVCGTTIKRGWATWRCKVCNNVWGFDNNKYPKINERKLEKQKAKYEKIKKERWVKDKKLEEEAAIRAGHARIGDMVKVTDVLISVNSVRLAKKVTAKEIMGIKTIDGKPPRSSLVFEAEPKTKFVVVNVTIKNPKQKDKTFLFPPPFSLKASGYTYDSYLQTKPYGMAWLARALGSQQEITMEIVFQIPKDITPTELVYYDPAYFRTNRVAIKLEEKGITKSKEAPPKETPEEDPSKILKLRLAKGEITKEEYEEMKKALET